VAGFSDFIEKLGRPPEKIRDENLRAWTSTLPGVTPIKDVTPRKRCKVAGVIQNIRIDPREGRGSIEATIIDGSGEFSVKWLGRPTMTGIRLGMGLVVEGTVGSGSDGMPAILNPDYQLIPGPEHG
jgi:hypothetical protein